MTFAERIIQSAKLNPQVYEEVEADKTAIGQAMLVVILSSLAAGVAILDEGAVAIMVGALSALVGWFVWAFITYIVGAKLLPEPQTKADTGELLRTLGFAASPGLLRVFGLIPGLMEVVFVITGLWMLAATVIAVRQALDYNSTLRAVGVCVIGWLIQAFILAGLMFFGGAFR
jgi:hypothetical protein